jgi:hypothetical protein
MVAITSDGFSVSLKYHRAAHELRQKDSQKLSKDVAERQQVQETDRVHPAFVLKIFPNLHFQRCNVRENIAMRNYNSLGLGRRTRSEDDLQRVRGFDLGGLIGGRRMRFQRFRQVLQSERCDRLLHVVTRAHQQLGVDLLMHS